MAFARNQHGPCIGSPGRRGKKSHFENRMHHLANIGFLHSNYRLEKCKQHFLVQENKQTPSPGLLILAAISQELENQLLNHNTSLFQRG